MPLWGDLGKAVEADLPDFSSTGAIDALSAYEHEYGRARLIDRLSTLLHIRDAQPGDAHRAFCSIKFDLVCTTNFDFLLEKQYDLIPRHVNPLVDEEQLSLSGVRNETLLLKLHGDLRHPSRLVVTEADYDAFLSRYPLLATYLANLLITKTAVLIGYSLDDPDFRQVWSVVTQRLGRARRQAYAIAVGAQPTDVARFARRGVTLINLPRGRKKYGEILAAVFDELAEYLRNHVLEVSTVTEEAPLRELKLPKGVGSRLVFFAVPLSRLSIYRARVFPQVEALGLVPVTADDVVSPEDSVSAKIDALVDRAVAVVVEIGGSWTSAELRLALSRAREPAGIPVARIVIVEGLNAPPLPLEIDHLPIVRISPIPESDEGLNQLVAALEQVVPSDVVLGQEATRLLNSGEHRAAVIAAMSLLEDRLRRHLGKPVWGSVSRPMSLRQLIENVLPQRDVPNPGRISEWVRIRNRAVHENTPVSHDIASAIVSGVQEVLRYLE